MLRFERGSVESLSTITCKRAISPLDGFGSTVTQNAAVRRSLVAGHSTILSRSVWTYPVFTDTFGFLTSSFDEDQRAVDNPCPRDADGVFS